MRRQFRRSTFHVILIASSAIAPASAVDVADTSFLHEPAIGGGSDRLRLRRRPLDRHGRRLRRPPARPRIPGPSRAPTSRPTAGSSPSPRPTTATPTSTSSRSRAASRPGSPGTPGPTSVVGFSPDGSVLFRSPRSVFSNRYTQFFTVEPQGRLADALAGPQRLPRGLFARRQVPGLHAAQRAVPPVEELPGRHGLADLDHEARRPRRRGRPPARGAVQRHLPDVGRRHGLLPLRPRGRVQPLLVRSRSRRRSSSSPATRTSRSSRPRPARARSSTSRAGGSGPSTPPARRRRGSRSASPPTWSRPGPGTSTGREVSSGPPTSRRPASAPSSSSAARS